MLMLTIFINKEKSDSDKLLTKKTEKEKETIINMSNPASKFCEENGGDLEMIKNNDGSEFGMCHLDGYSCDEWAYFRGKGETVEDSKKIKKALISKGLSLSEMKIVIYKHLGKYIEGGVVPISMPAGGGGYVFAVKENDEIKIVADGNGMITCKMLDNYPDFSSYLIPQCVDNNGDLVSR